MSKNTQLAQDLLELQKDIETAQQKVNKAEGAYEQIMEQLEKEFECEDLEQAEKQAKQLKVKIEKMENEFEKEAEKFYAEYENKINEFVDGDQKWKKLALLYKNK